jgi:hypothetical protein
MGRSQADIWVTALVAALAAVVGVAGGPVVATAVLGLALFMAPGYLLAQILLGPAVAGLERFLVSAVLALAVPALGGLALYAAGVPLERHGWLGLLAGVTLAADAVLFLSRRLGRSAPFTWQPSWRLTWRQTVVYGAAVLVAAGGVTLARVGVSLQKQTGFTQLWLSPPRTAAHTLNLGVTNDQGSATSYRVVLRRNGKVSQTWNLVLDDKQTWQTSVPFTGQANLVADLYRTPNLTTPYRYVSTNGSKALGS